MTPIIVGGSVRGESHIRHNVERQDSYLIIDGIHRHDRKAHYYQEMPSDVRIVAIADGHGSDSCPYSKTGSQTATNVFCDAMAEYAAKYKDNMPELFSMLNKEGEATRIGKWIVGEWEKRILQYHAMEKRDIPQMDSGEPDTKAIWKLYGTTLLGLLITVEYIFAFQLGDGDITFVDETGVSPVIDGDKILGVETHSISKPDSWKKMLTRVVSVDKEIKTPFMYVLSTDGWLNSHASEDEFHKTCMSYYELIKDKGANVVEENLEGWLSETSKMGCGDDITAVFVYFGEQ